MTPKPRVSLQDIAALVKAMRDELEQLEQTVARLNQVTAKTAGEQARAASAAESAAIVTDVRRDLRREAVEGSHGKALRQINRGVARAVSRHARGEPWRY